MFFEISLNDCFCLHSSIIFNFTLLAILDDFSTRWHGSLKVFPQELHLYLCCLYLRTELNPKISKHLIVLVYSSSIFTMTNLIL